MKIRSFTKSDYYGFAGVESKDPQINDEEVTVNFAYGKTGSATVIIDDAVVDLYTYCEEGNQVHETFYTAEFKDWRQARGIVKMLPTTLDAALLEEVFVRY